MTIRPLLLEQEMQNEIYKTKLGCTRSGCLDQGRLDCYSAFPGNLLFVAGWISFKLTPFLAGVCHSGSVYLFDMVNALDHQSEIESHLQGL